MAQAGTKKVFFGGLFDFSTNAVNEVIERFLECLPDPDSAPFVSYDKFTKAFSFTCNQRESTAVPIFISNLKEYLDHQQSLQQHIELDLEDSPKLRPIEGTVIKEPTNLDEGREGQLINIDQDSSSDSDGGQTDGPKPDGLAPLTEYWKPEAGNIDILTTNIAQELAQLTGSSLDPEPARKRVKIFGGDIKTTLAKLVNLEKLMTCLAFQRPTTTSAKASGNMLMIRSTVLEPRVEFKRLLLSFEPGLRIMVDEPTRAVIDRKCIGELRVQNFGNYRIPDNLQKPELEKFQTSSRKQSAIWSSYTFPQIGDVTNTMPSIVTPPQSPSRTDTKLVKKALSSKYLSSKDNENIKQWTQDVTEPGDPSSIPEPPTEEVPPPKVRRRVAVDSDDEDEPLKPTTVLPPHNTRALDRMIHGGSEEGSEIDAPKSSRRRAVLRDSDDSSSGDELPKRMAEASPMIRSEEEDVTLLFEKTSASQTYPVRESLPQQSSSVAQLINIEPSEIDLEIHPSSFPFDQPRPSIFNSFPDIEIVEKKPSPERCPLTDEGVEIPVSDPVFDTAKYGKVSHGPNQNSSKRGQSNRGNQSRSRAQGQGRGGPLNKGELVLQLSPARSLDRQAMPSPTKTPEETRDTQVGGRAQARRGSIPTVRGGLIQFNSSIGSATSPPPPPGFGLRMPSIPATTPFSPEPANLLDHNPQDAINQPALRPGSSRGQAFPLPSPVGPLAHSGSNVFSGNGNPFYASHCNPGFQIGAVRYQRLERLLELQQAQRSRAFESLTPKVYPNTERRQTDDETAIRRYHRTMRQQAPNPRKGKSKSTPKKESKKEQQERRNQALAEAFPPAKPLARQADSPIIASRRDEQSSDNKPNSIKVAPLVGVKGDQVETLINTLAPLFEAGRAFPGKLQFEMQLGRALVPYAPTMHMEEGILFSSKRWDRLFNPDNGQQPLMTSFTNLLTSNGADIDRLLEIKESPKLKLWSKSRPGPKTVTYEFHCQSKDNDEFWLIVDQHGDFSIRNNPTTIGMTNLHYPGQVWDAAAVLSGRMKGSEPSPEVEETAKLFVQGLYVQAAESEIKITYHLPTTNEITIRNLVMKRVSLHDCLAAGKEDFRLQVTEVKTLYHRFHPRDKKLGFGCERAREEIVENQIVEHGRLHYEVSLVDKSVNEVLEKNFGLDFGELTDLATTGKSLLKYAKIQSMLDLTTFILGKIDWMGYHNIGTLHRVYEEEYQKAASRGQNMGGLASRLIAGSVMNATASRHVPSLVGGNASRFTRARFVPGVRMNTDASIFQVEGKWYRHGMGGAHVPMRDEDLHRLGLVDIQEETEEGEVGPDDSASQIGGPSVPRAAGGRYPPHMIQRKHRNTGPGPDRGSGYW